MYSALRAEPELRCEIMMKKRYMLVATLLLWGAVGAGAQTLNPKDKKQMYQLAYDACVKTNDASVCNCFADQLSKNFEEKDWKIFIADMQKSSALPQGVSESDLDAYGAKLSTAGNACGLR